MIDDEKSSFKKIGIEKAVGRTNRWRHISERKRRINTDKKLIRKRAQKLSTEDVSFASSAKDVLFGSSDQTR